MKNKINNSILSLLGRLFIAGMVAMTLQGARLQAQYVSTAISNGLASPTGATVDGNGNVYITDTDNNRIVKYVRGTGAVTVLAGSTTPGLKNAVGTAAQFYYPYGIVYARGGLVVVDQYNQVLRFISLANNAVTTLAGINSPYGGDVDGSTSVAQFSYPAGIAADGAGNLYIADWGNDAVRMLSAGNVVSTLAPSYPFNSPTAVAVDSNTNIWVADSQNYQIVMISNGVAQVMAGNGSLGSVDSPIATQAEFNLPNGLLWDNGNNLLVIADTRNDTIRKLYMTNYQGVAGYAVQTVAGIAGISGYVDGALGTSEFHYPFGMCTDAADSGYYVADAGNNVLRILQPTKPPAPPTPVGDPVIGYLTFPLVGTPPEPSAVFNPITTSGIVFNNTVVIAIEQNDITVQTYYTEGATGSVPLPTTSSPNPLIFTSADLGLLPSQVPGSQAGPLPDLTIYAISEAPPRPNSDVVSAEMKFVTANPTIIGNNSASEATANFTDITTNAEIYYTLDGNAPTNGAADTSNVFAGTTIQFPITSNTTLTAQAVAANFAPSGIVTALFSPTNVNADAISFGFEAGEGSSQFITAPGQTFIAPVTLSLISSGETMYTLQFNLAITNLGAAPDISTNAPSVYTFSSMLDMPLPGSSPPVYVPIPPAMFALGVPTNTGLISNIFYIPQPSSYLTTNNGVVTTNYVGLMDLLFTNAYMLGVGWVERPPETNLYPSTSQTLITYSMAHDTLFKSSGGQVIVGAFSFTVPTNATLGQKYEIEVGSPSATSDGISTPVLIQTPTNGSMINGAINSLKYVTVSNAQYLVGDTAPFYWFNAGDFGDGLLQNNDVTEVFQTAVYGLNGPDAATAKSDYFDAMDSSNGSTNNTYYTLGQNGNDDAFINAIKFGDGVLEVDDVYVTYRRSLDPTLTWYDRSDTAAGKVATVTSNLVSPLFPGAAPAAGGAPAIQVGPAGPRYITVAAADVQASPGNLAVQVPIQVLAADPVYPICTMMLRVEIDPLNGSPPITSGIAFSANTNLGTAWTSASQSPSDFASVWLNPASTGVSGTGTLGTLYVTLPANITTNSSYLVHFDHFSASPNGIALFTPTVQDGLITIGTGGGSGSGSSGGVPNAPIPQIQTAAQPGGLSSNSSSISLASTTTNSGTDTNVAKLSLAAVAGDYNGLFTNADGNVTVDTSGMLSGLKVKTNGAYSGTIQFKGASHSISGHFDTNSFMATNTQIARLVIMMTLPSTSGLLTGTVSNTTASWVANLNAEPAATMPAGKYTMLIPGGSPAPVGDGFAVIDNSANGSATLSLWLPDGASFSESVHVAAGGDVPIFSDLYNGQGVLLGWINLTNNPAPLAPLGLTWVHPTRSSDLFQTAFTNSSTPATAPWTNSTNSGLSNLTSLAVVGTINTTTNITTSATGEIKVGNTKIGSISKKGVFTVTVGSGGDKGTGVILLNGSTPSGGGYYLKGTNAAGSVKLGQSQ